MSGIIINYITNFGMPGFWIDEGLQQLATASIQAAELKEL